MNRNVMSLYSRFKGTKLGTWLRHRRWNQQLVSIEGITKTINTHMGDTVSAEQKAALLQDILYTAKKYRFSAEEYFCYHFADKSEEERASFISDLNRIEVVEKLNQAKNLVLFDDKIRTAEVFGAYYHRQVCCVRSADDKDALNRFVSDFPRFIAKPLNGTCGMGVQIVDLTNENNIAAQLNNLIEQYCSGTNAGFIVEELITQVPAMAQLHPASVNSIRVATILYPEGAEVLASFLRVGRGESIVDNAGAGGIIGTLDLNTGCVIAAADEYGNSFDTHPDTGLPLIGFQIPRWEEAKAMACELATIVKGNRYAGWDLALTENGWVMVEGNARGQFVWQMPTQKGFWPEMNRVFNRLGMKEMKNHGI